MKSSSLDRGARLAFLVIAPAASTAPMLAFGAPADSPEVTAPQMIDAFEGDYGVHPGQRRNHTKGTCASGEFVGTSNAAALSRSALFSGKAVPVVARFSVGGGNPEEPDAGPAPRGMALEFRLPGGTLQHHFTAGTLTITEATPQQKGIACEPINFDPLRMADGIAPTNDPVLLFRSPAYAVSFAKRLSGQ